MKTFLLDIDSENTLEVTILAKPMKESIYYYAKYVNTNISDYKKRGSVIYKEETTRKPIYYKNINEFENDLKKALKSDGVERLKSKI